MNFRLSRKEFALLAFMTLAIGLMQVLTPIYLRTLVDGILPSKDGLAIASVLLIIGANELLLVFASASLNRSLDTLERDYTHELRRWMLIETSRQTSALKNSDAFYQSWSQEARRLVYKKIKNPWHRAKDFIVLMLLSLICLNISYLAGILVLVIAGISLFLVSYTQDGQAQSTRHLHTLLPQERKLFDQAIAKKNPGEKSTGISELEEISRQVDETQYRVARERTGYQDVNNLIRFILMFSILGVGGYLVSTESMSMGSLWALLITMYRITPPLQSLVRWILQSRSEENLEGRILENMQTKEIFKKPLFYNRLVKLLERSLKEPGRRIVTLPGDMNIEELLNSLHLWWSFYTSKEKVLISTELPHDGIEKLCLIIADPQLTSPQNCVFFTKTTQLEASLLVAFEVSELK